MQEREKGAAEEWVSRWGALKALLQCSQVLQAPLTDSALHVPLPPLGFLALSWGG